MDILMHTKQRHTGHFKAKVVKDLLFNVSITHEICSRFGLTAAEVRGLLHHTIDHVDDIFSARASYTAPVHRVHKIVNENELHLLLDSFDHPL